MNFPGKRRGHDKSAEGVIMKVRRVNVTGAAMMAAPKYLSRHKFTLYFYVDNLPNKIARKL